LDNELRPPLLALHKAVLAAERSGYEKVHGQVSNTEFLQIVQDRLRYGWLVPLTQLVLDLDEDEDVRARARELLKPPQADTPFGRRYLSLMQRAPELVVLHRAVTRLL
jgi:hypothetical protein